MTVQNKNDTRRYAWTSRHWWPYVFGAISGGGYAIGVRWGAEQLHIQLAPWVIPVTAQAALFLGVFFCRLMLFDRK